MKAQQQTSSGGVVFRTINKKIEVALIYVNGRKEWCLPKGLVEKGEAMEYTALREVREETGLNGRIAGKIGSINYWYIRKEGEDKVKFFKTVHFFLMEYIDGNIDDHDWEVEEARWFTIEEAIEIAEYKSEKETLRKALEMIRNRYKS